MHRHRWVCVVVTGWRENFRCGRPCFWSFLLRLRPYWPARIGITREWHRCIAPPWNLLSIAARAVQVKGGNDVEGTNSVEDTNPVEGTNSVGPNALVSIIMPVYNQWAYTKECLAAIHRYTPENHEVIVVNNGSTDETLVSLQNLPMVKRLDNDHNEGFPKACNQGMAMARGDTLVILNNDVVVSHNWLKNLLHCLYADDRHGAVGPVTNWVSGGQCRAQPYDTLERFHSFAEQYNHTDSTRWDYALRLVGFCLVLRKSVYEQVGGFDEQFGRGNFEDDDYCLRVRRAGYKLVVAGDTYVHHHGSITNRADVGFAQLLQGNQARFVHKWGVNPWYSVFTREDLADLVPPVKRVLDVGCACGGLGLTLKNRGVAEVAGIELDPAAAVDARTVLDDVWVGDASSLSLPRPPGWYEALVFADVLEHMVDPLAALVHLLTYLKPGGVVVASIPNVGHISVLQGLLNGTWTYQSAGVLDRTHLRFFTLVEMQRLLNEAGLTLEFVGMVQDVTPEQEQFLTFLSTAVESQHLDSQGPSLPDRCRTVQYYLRARKAFAAVKGEVPVG
ncbi:glycosyltransferase [Alicyclobacillaceae bacterium I2511]|nr:glycosyltransferase [Alicyclobacillaceae bacterium I2511]